MFIIVTVLTMLCLSLIRTPTTCGTWDCEISTPALVIYIVASLIVASIVEYLLWKHRRGSGGH